MGVIYKTGDSLDRVCVPTNFRFNILRVLTEFIQKYCRKQDTRILDVGCGNGIYSLYFLSSGATGSYLGIDISEKFIGKDWLRFSSLPGRLRIEFRVLNAASLTDSVQGTFNSCICLVMLEHVREYQEILPQIYKLMEAGGYTLIIVPSKYTWLFSMGRHGYHFFSQDAILTQAKAHNFTLIECIRVGGIFGFFFDLSFSWIMSTLCKFINVDEAILKLTTACGKRYQDNFHIMRTLDRKFPFLEAGYAYILKKNQNTC